MCYRIPQLLLSELILEFGWRAQPVQSSFENPVKFGICFATMEQSNWFTVSSGLILTFDIAASARTRCRAAASQPSSAPELMKSTIERGERAQKQKIAFHTMQEYMCLFQYMSFQNWT